MCSTSIFTFVIRWSLPLQYFLSLIFLYKYNSFLHFYMIPAVLFFNKFVVSLLNLIILTASSLNDSKNISVQSLPLYTSCLFSMIFYDFEKRDWIWSSAFGVDEFSGLFLHTSILSIKHSIFILVFLEGISILKKSLFYHTF